ncbi:MAG: glycosyltransferase [Verrucomicrobiota bacterium]
MHVCHVMGSHREVGGLEKNVRELAAAQVAEGMKVSVLCSDAMGALFEAPVKVMPVRMERSRRDPRLGWEVKKRLRELKPQVVHAHANKAAEVLAGVSLPKVATVHGVKKRTEVFGKFDRVIVPSEVVRETLEGMEAEVIWNAVPPFEEAWVEEAKELGVPFLGRGPIVYAAGRMAEVKGYDLLLEAVSRVEGVKLWLVGDGPEREKLEWLAEKFGLLGRVWMPGFVREEQLVGLMRMADCFVISSRREAGPYTLAQALRARCAVVSARVGMAPEFLGDEQLVGEATVENLEMGLRRFLDGAEGYREEMGECFERAERELDRDEMVGKVTRVYEGVLARRSW